MTVAEFHDPAGISALAGGGDFFPLKPITNEMKANTTNRTTSHRGKPPIDACKSAFGSFSHDDGLAKIDVGGLALSAPSSLAASAGGVAGAVAGGVIDVGGASAAGGVSTGAGSVAAGLSGAGFTAGASAGFAGVALAETAGFDAGTGGTGFDSGEAGSSATTGVFTVDAVAIAGTFLSDAAGTAGSGSSGTTGLFTTCGAGGGVATATCVTVDAGGSASSVAVDVFTVPHEDNASDATMSIKCFLLVFILIDRLTR